MVSKAEFEESVLPHMKAAFNLAYWIVRSREEAEDVVQDAVVRAFRAFSRFDGAAPRQWLLTIVRNVAYRALENRNRAGNVVLFSEDLKNGERGDVRDIPSLEQSAETLLVAESERHRCAGRHRDVAPVARARGAAQCPGAAHRQGRGRCSVATRTSP
jgi:RNA polymerase sigma-70 factor (ECF subfamily)